MNNKICIFTDGSCLNNGKKNSIGSIGIFFSDNDPKNVSQVIDNDGIKITNQTMELLACVQAFRIFTTDKNQYLNQIIYIYTDSSYLINCMTKWYNIWEKNEWKTTKGKDVENKELIQILYNLKSQFIIIFKHVRSHQDEPKNKESENYQIWYGNFMADKLATDASKKYIKSKEQSDNNINEIEDIDQNQNQNQNQITKNKLTNKKKIKQIMNI
jgi:ribonuclease HI